MWNVRILLLVLLFGVSIGLGWIQYYRLILHCKILMQYISAISFLEREIRFVSVPISEVLWNYRDQVPLFQSCVVHMEQGDSFSQAWRKKVNLTSVLSQTERESLIEFGMTFGTMDKQDQLLSCERTIHHLQECYEDAKRINRQKSRLYLSMGAICGGGLVILLI